MTKDHRSGAACYCDAIEDGSNGHDREVLTLPIVDRVAPNNGNVKGVIGDRTHFVERHVSINAPPHDLKRNKAFGNG